MTVGELQRILEQIQDKQMPVLYPDENPAWYITIEGISVEPALIDGQAQDVLLIEPGVMGKGLL